MPEISRFNGIIIAMYYDDHNPPHFHVRYGKDKASLEILTLRVLDGSLPHRILNVVIEWANQHQEELLRNWEETKNNRQPMKIAPLS
jgi:hypothetical protein